MLYYGSGDIANTISPDRIYEYGLQPANLSKIMGVAVADVIPTTYPPQSILFFAPLAKLAPQDAFVIWQLINIVITFISVILLHHFVLEKKDAKSLLITSLLIVTTYPWIASIKQGQVTILMTAALLGFDILVKHKKYVFAGFLLVLTAFKPPLFFAPALYLLIIFGKPLWYATIAAGIAIVAFCSLFFDLSIWLEYIKLLTIASEKATDTGLNVTVSTSIRSLLVVVLGAEALPVINIVCIALLALIIITSALMGYKLRSKSQTMQELGFAVAIAMNCLFNPWVPTCSLLFLVLSVAYLVKYSDFKPAYLYIGGLINFTLVVMFVEILNPQLNSAMWVPFQLILISLLFRRIIQENKKSSSLAVVS